MHLYFLYLTGLACSFVGFELTDAASCSRRTGQLCKRSPAMYFPCSWPDPRRDRKSTTTAPTSYKPTTKPKPKCYLGDTATISNNERKWFKLNPQKLIICGIMETSIYFQAIYKTETINHRVPFEYNADECDEESATILYDSSSSTAPGTKFSSYIYSSKQKVCMYKIHI